MSKDQLDCLSGTYTEHALTKATACVVVGVVEIVVPSLDDLLVGRLPRNGRR